MGYKSNLLEYIDIFSNPPTPLRINCSGIFDNRKPATNIDSAGTAGKWESNISIAVLWGIITWYVGPFLIASSHFQFDGIDWTLHRLTLFYGHESKKVGPFCMTP